MAAPTRRIILVQHALAVSEKEDPARPISSEGLEATMGVVGMLSASKTRASGPLAQTVIHSGKLRAKQTAEVLSAGLGATVVEERAGLGPNDDPAAFWTAAEEEEAWRRSSSSSEGGGLAIVGHLPFMERLVGHLVAGDAAKAVVKLSNSGPLCLEADDQGLWRIAWMLPPSLSPK
mmetsp:Transcript_45828/g.108739  ORF Transcript_45828/g.108739 Transcript_45828/m.108739 type:complete len:176 (-) Transcript_45828:73-600(-)